MTASYPFTREPVAQPGALPASRPKWDTRPHRFWLGQPGAMIELPSPDPSLYQAPRSRGEVEQGLASGASGMIRFPHSVSRWTLGWPRLAGRNRSVVDGFYRGAFGSGPFCFVPPEDVNRLTLKQSMCGALNGVAEGWVASVGTVTYNAAVASPVAPCGVLDWSAEAANALLMPGINAGPPTPDPSFSIPYLPAEPFAWSVWLSTASGTASVRLVLSGRNAAGTVVTAVNGPTVTVSAGAWTLLQMSLNPGDLTTSPYVLPLLQSLDGHPVRVSAPQAEFRNFRTDWDLGSGVPRVNWVAGRDTRTFDTHMNMPDTMVLADAVVGRA